MGWIRLGLPTPNNNPAKHLHSLAARVEVDNIVSETQSQPQSNQNGRAPKHYPFQPTHLTHSSLPFIPSSEVAQHTGEAGTRLWIVVENTVLDVTQYLCRHPGGQQIIRGFGGQDCSWQWWTFHGRKVWNEVAVDLRVGRTEGVENRHVKPKPVGVRGLGYHEDFSHG